MRQTRSKRLLFAPPRTQAISTAPRNCAQSRNSRSFIGAPQAAWRSSWCYGRSGRPPGGPPGCPDHDLTNAVFIDPPLVPDLLERPALDHALSHRPRPHRHCCLFGLQGGGPLPSQLELALGALEMPFGPQNPGIGLGDRLLGLRQPLLCVHYGAPGPLNLSLAHFVPSSCLPACFRPAPSITHRFKSNGPLKART